jgi:hypothetical protein
MRYSCRRAIPARELKISHFSVKIANQEETVHCTLTHGIFGPTLHLESSFFNLGNPYVALRIRTFLFYSQSVDFTLNTVQQPNQTDSAKIFSNFGISLLFIH